MESELYFDAVINLKLNQELNQDQDPVSIEQNVNVDESNEHQLMMPDFATGAIFNWKNLYEEETHFENFKLCCGEEKSERHVEAEMTCQYGLSFPLPEHIITIAVDATPRRAGGILVLPRKQQIYFYSVPWSLSFDFYKRPMASHEFEMTNAYLAMKLFVEIIYSYRDFNDGKNDNLVLITDNVFYRRVPQFYNEYSPKWKILLDKMEADLSTSSWLRGRWQYGNRSSDFYIYIADRLSREDLTESINFLEFNDPRLNWLFRDYQFVNLSKQTEPILGKIAEELANADQLHGIIANISDDDEDDEFNDKVVYEGST